MCFFLRGAGWKCGSRGSGTRDRGPRPADEGGSFAVDLRGGGTVAEGTDERGFRMRQVEETDGRGGI